MRSRIAVLLVCSTGTLGSVASGQQPAAQLLLAGGSGTDIRGVRSTAMLVSPSVTFHLAPASHLMVSARGKRYGTGEWSWGAGARLRSRHRLAGPLGLGFDGSAGLTRTSYNVRFLTWEAAPALNLRLGPAELFGGVRSAAARAAIGSDLPTPPLGDVGDQTVARSSFGPVFGGSLRVATFGPGDGLLLTYREERSTVESIRAIDRSIGASLIAGPTLLGITWGQRESPGEAKPFGGVTLSIAATRTLTIIGSYEEYLSDRLTGALGGRTVSAGIAWRIGGTGGPGLPKPAGIPAPERGVTRLAIRESQARVVEIAGDWNHWKPEPARRAANGVWYVDLRLEPGEYRYAFRIDGSRWAVPDGTPSLEDGFGGRSAWVVVKQPG